MTRTILLFLLNTALLMPLHTRGHHGTDTTLWTNPYPVVLNEYPPIDGDDIRHVGKPVGAALAAVQKARGFIAQLKSTGNLIERITSQDLVDLPVGVSKTIGNVTFTMGIAEARLLSTHTEVDIYLEIDLPDQDEDLFFGAEGIGFSREGGFVGDVSLSLLGDYPLDVRAGKSRIVFQQRSGERGTYAMVGCDGFKELNVEGYILFSRDWLLPVNGDTLPASPGGGPAQPRRVRGDFAFNAQSWDFVVSLSNFERFSVKGVDDVHWEVGGITLDFSELENSPDVVLPPDYVSPFVEGSTVSSLWRGVYIENVQVKLPDKFSAEGAPPIVVDAERIIIDEQGFTGKIGVYNILPLNQGNADGWAFSVDTFKIDIMAMQLREGSMAGLLNVPLLAKAQVNGGGSDGVMGPEDCLEYSAVICTGNQYHFTARARTDYKASVWKADVIIEANSTVALNYENGNLRAGATLFGSISVADDFGGAIDVSMESIRFENLVLSTQAPFLESGYWGFPNSLNASLGSFGLCFHSISLNKGESAEQIELKFAAAIELSGGVGAIAATGGFRIEGELESQHGRSRWAYRRFKVESIYVEASTSAWGLAGGLHFYERHPVYGNGFRGMVKVWFAGISTPEAQENPSVSGIEAIGQFGSVAQGGQEEFRYFFVDVMARWANGLPLGTLNLMGAGGGVFHRMMPQSSGLNLAQPPAPVTALGSSLSGIVYNPDSSRGLRIKVTLVVASQGSEDAFSVNGTLEVVTNSSGGLDTVRVYGNVTVFADINWDNTAPPASQTGITILIDMVYDNVGEERGFTAAADVFINMASGNLFGNAGGAPNYAGGIDIKFTNQTWYVNVGTPTAPIRLNALFGPVRPNVSAYLDMGNNIPPMPDLPDFVSHITGAESNFMRNESLYATGAGVAFGASASVISGRQRAGFLYYELDFGLGFDLMLQNYGEAQCANTGGGRIGINGWYASGQAWAFLQGVVGIHLEIPLVFEGDFDVLQASIGAVLQAKGPNPFWGAARVAGQYRILNGLVKGNFRMRVEVGESCIMTTAEGDAMANMNLIMSTQPSDNQNNFSVEGLPTALMNLPFDEPFDLNEDEYKLVLVGTQLKRNNQTVYANIHKESGDNQVEIAPHDQLYANTLYRFEVEVALLKKVGASFSDTIKTEQRTVSFRTGAGIEQIPVANIKHSYPMDGQRYVYPQESAMGYIELHQGQSALLSSNVQLRFTAASGAVINVPAQYQAGPKRLTFSLSGLALSTVYRMEVLKPATAGNQEGDSNDANGPYAWHEEVAAQEERILLSLYFSTSQFATFSAKVSSITALTLNAAGVATFSCNGEPFDALELQGGANEAALLGLQVNLTDHSWYQSHNFQTLLYDEFPMLDPVLIPNTWRPEDLGYPPAQAISLGQVLPPAVDAAAFASGGQAAATYLDTLLFRVPHTIHADYQGYKSQVDSLVLSWAQQEMSNFAGGDGGTDENLYYDYNNNGVINLDDMIKLISRQCDDPNACSPYFEGKRCPQFSGAFPCPIPASIGRLYRSNLAVLNTVRGQVFDIILTYTLPGAGSPNSTAQLRVTMNP